MKRKIHIVPHSHWDREWYFTTSRSKVYLMKDLRDVLDTLEQNEDFKYFMVDAQGSLLDDYLKWMPQDEERIARLVKARRLVIGPWYTQTDQMVISAESIVRNLYYGMKRCETLGGYMNVGYVPDSFGQSGNMPQIYRAFGIEDTLFWRGVSDDMVEHTDFNWRGDDGSVVFATQIPFGYYIGGNIPEQQPESDTFWEDECLKKAGSRSATRHIYFPNGFDQAPIRTNLPELVAQRALRDPDNEYVISCVEDYIRDVKSESPELDEVSGELVIAKHMRIHKSIFSSRSDLKAMNTQLQNYVTNVMEPVLTLSHSLGNDYPAAAVAEIWKLLFENAAHDSIGSCISDTANEDVFMRYKQVRDIAVNLVELQSRLIATSVANDAPMTLTLLNPLPQTRTETVVCRAYIPGGAFSIVDESGNEIAYTILRSRDLTDYVLSQTIRLDPCRNFYVPEQVLEADIAFTAPNVPAMGYVQYGILPGANSRVPYEPADCLENEYYRITVAADGSLTIEDKQLHFTYQNQAVLVENGDDGDSFNYSPPRRDMEISSTKAPQTVSIHAGKDYGEAKITFQMRVPADLEERARGIVSTEMPVTLRVALRAASRVIDLNVHVDNHGLSHRLCILFDAQLKSSFSFADQQFGAIRRPNYYAEEMALYQAGRENASGNAGKTGIQQLANWANDQTTWQEPPIAIEPTQSYVSLTDDTRGIAVIPQGVREYEILDDQMIRLTLMRTYGFMGKENLVYRPGRASGERIIETKDAQLLKELDFSLGFTTYAGGINDSGIDVLAKMYNTGIQPYVYAPFLNGRLLFSEPEITGCAPKHWSLFETDGRLVVSAIKKAEDREGILIRLYNGKYREAVSDTLRFSIPIKTACYTNLREEDTEPIEIIDQTITVKELSHCKFVTIYIK